ncbi:MAG TPA: response regulator [Firmicutes bacterium]|nr:response regulator [Bacillota bacterium]
MKKVLVVDDTKNIRTLLTMCLELEGYQVITACNGREALTLLQSEPLDLAFLDIKLPEITGTEVFRRAREDGVNTPIIIMTAFATVKNAVECTKLGAVLYLQKPFTAEKVRRILQEITQTLSPKKQDVEGYLLKAKNLIAVGKLAEAFELLKSSLAIDPSYGEIYQLIAAIYTAQGDSKEAERFQTIARQFEDTSIS